MGRQEELNRLWHQLQPASSQSRKVAILHGLGGIGKTQLAIRFARDHKRDFTAIFWLSGNDRGSLLQSLSSVLARLPGIPQTNDATNDEEVEQNAKQVLKWLAMEENSSWLLIFDNIDQYSTIKGVNGSGYDISDFFPAADHGSIIITTRLPKLVELGTSYSVERLDPEASVQLLLQSCGLSDRSHSSQTAIDPGN